MLFRSTTARRDEIEDGAGVVAAIRDDVPGRAMSGEEVADGCLVGGLPGQQRDRDWQAAVIDHGIDLGAQSSTRATEGVILPPFFAAACWWARMIELSMNCMLSGDRSISVSKTRTHTPALAQRLKRL